MPPTAVIGRSDNKQKQSCSRAHGRGSEIQAEEGAVVAHVVRLYHSQRVRYPLPLSRLLRQVHHGCINFPENGDEKTGVTCI